MTPVDGRPLNIAGVMVGEIRVRRMGPAPMQGSRVVLMTEEGVSLSNSLFNVFSPRTLKLIDTLCRSIEDDYLNLITSQELPSEVPESDEDDGGSPSFG